MGAGQYHGLSPIRGATYFHQYTTAAILLSRGVSPFGYNDALYHAVALEDEKMVAILLAHGADAYHKQGGNIHTPYGTASPEMQKFIMSQRPK